ncbi:MAG: class I SAM-dependent methyltransferase [Anaerolineales bacterium]
MYQSYENYSETSSTYDDTRIPVGLRIILRVLWESETPPERTRLLDAGCGTGSYLASLRDRLGILEGLEFDPGMLERARQKLSAVDNVVLHRGSVLAMPFPDGQFDAVMFNQVIHHLDDERGGSANQWPNLRQALTESRRVLRDGGVILINTCTQQQITDGFWYAPLIPDAVAKLARRYIPVDVLHSLLAELQFDVGKPEVPLNETFDGNRAIDLAGPFDKAWRNGDSVWALATDTELQEALARLQAMREANEAEAFVSQRDALRQRVGQCVFIQAWRD